MINKEEKKHWPIKIILLAIVGFFVILAFIEPQPVTQHVEKQLNVPIK